MQTKYIVAVSGGVDSVVLLHKIMSVKPDNITYIVAHFDHGIRDDSAEDAEFVKALAKKYKSEFVCERAELGKNSSEDEARNRRYGFLHRVKNKYKAEAIITAHHRDDVIETMLVNILRGTGPRGLIGYTQVNILRPLISKTKKELRSYAKKHDLKWREDSTNLDQKYLRNYIRINLVPELSKSDKARLLEIREGLQEKYIEIDSLSKKFLVQVMRRGEIKRSSFITLPYIVQKEIIATSLRLENVEINKEMVERAVIAIKTLATGKHVELKKHVTLYSRPETVLLKITPQSV